MAPKMTKSNISRASRAKIGGKASLEPCACCGIAPDPQGTPSYDASAPTEQTMADRGIFHAADAMRSMYEMGDAPSCSTCGAIMVRNGSCYRCMSCGSTSGCS